MSCDKCLALEAELAEAKRAHADWQDVHGSAEAECERLRAELHQANALLAADSREEDRLRAEVERFKAARDTREKTMGEWARQITHLTAERDAALAEIASLKHAAKIASDTTKQFVAQYDQSLAREKGLRLHLKGLRNLMEASDMWPHRVREVDEALEAGEGG